MLKYILPILFERKYYTSTNLLNAGTGIGVVFRPSTDEWVWIDAVDISFTKKGQFTIYRYNTTNLNIAETIKDLNWDSATGIVLTWLDARCLNDETKMVSIGVTNTDAVQGTLKLNVEYYTIKNRIMQQLLNSLKQMFGIDYTVG